MIAWVSLMPTTWKTVRVFKLLGKDDPDSEHWDAVADLPTEWQFLEAKAEATP